MRTAAAASDAMVSRMASGAALAPPAQDRRQRDHREGQAIERLRQPVMGFGQIGVADLVA